MAKPKLKRELTLFSATLYGIGIIIGAGIYALIGQAAGIAGWNMWISFVVAAILATFTGLSYAELSSMMPKEGAEYVYSLTAFHRRSVSFIIGWIFLLSSIVAAATVALGFSGYFIRLFSMDAIFLVPISVGLIAVLTLINYGGMKDTSVFNIIASIFEFGGLFIIIFLGASFFGNFKVNIDIASLAANSYPILSAAALIFFAFIGFEEIANVSEETKKARKVVPKALMLSILITTILYILTAVAALSVLGPEALAASSAPLADVASAAAGSDMLMIMAIMAMISTTNTVLLSLVVASRFIYGMSCWHVLPRKFSKIQKHHHTPYISVFLVGFIAAVLTLGGDILSVAEVTTMSIFIIFISVNASLIMLRYKKPKAKRYFRSPLTVGKFPVLAGLGLVSSILILFYFPLRTWIVEAILVLAGIVAYYIIKKLRPKGHRID